MAMPVPNLGPRTRKVLRYAGFALVGLVTFILAFQMTFPFHRVKDKVIELLADKYEVTIGDVERGFIPGRMYFKAVTVRTRPTSSDEVASTLYIGQLEINLGLLALLRGTVAVKLDAAIGSGHIKGAIALSKDGTSVDVNGDDLPSAMMPMREVFGLPMSGKLRFGFELELPNEKTKAGKVAPNWLKAEGKAELACPSGCTVGDGKTKLKPKLKNQRNQAFAEGGIDFGKVNLDSLFGTAEIKNGKLSLTRFDVKSSDGEVHVDFDMALNQDLNSSLVTGCLRFNGTDVLRKREAKTYAALSTTGAPLGPDNLFHIKLEGPLREVRRLGLVCGPAVNGNTDNPSGTTARPNLTITPDTPAHPAGIPSPPAGVVSPPNPQMPVPNPAQMSPPPGPPPAGASMDGGAIPPMRGPPGPDGELPPTGQPPPPTGAAIEPPAGSAAQQ